MIPYADFHDLLFQMIRTPSFSRCEESVAEIVEHFLTNKGVITKRLKNNVYAYNKHFDPLLPTLLLNSHLDTVKPNKGYTRDPFLPEIIDGKLYGLGSNDAGGCVVSLIATFLYFYENKLPYNIILAITAEEEVASENGIELLLKHLPQIDCGIVGEPTEMHLAIAEKGLLVLDCKIKGVAGHAARNEGSNSIYKAIDIINKIREYKFERVSEFIGPVSANVTIINSGMQHNVVPASCSFTIDVRINELYTHEEVLAIYRDMIDGDVTPRSLRIRSSFISSDHPLVQSGVALKRKLYGSPTSSDKAFMTFPAVKLGPGFSGRSHSADEFIYVDEINDGIDLYIKILTDFFNERFKSSDNPLAKELIR